MPYIVTHKSTRPSLEIDFFGVHAQKDPSSSGAQATSALINTRKVLGAVEVTTVSQNKLTAATVITWPNKAAYDAYLANNGVTINLAVIAREAYGKANHVLSSTTFAGE